MSYGRMVGLEQYPNFRLQESYDGATWTIYQMQAKSPQPGIPDTWLPLPGDYPTQEAALAGVESFAAPVSTVAEAISIAAAAVQATTAVATGRGSPARDLYTGEPLSS